MRGKHFHANAAPWADGITPADAGKTQCQNLRVCIPWDHPRGCGENRVTTPAKVQCRGSPPRMRGKQGYTVQRTHQYRITPADAGKTELILSAMRGQTDHPRGCGENAAFACLCALFAGSPPRMRGKLSVTNPAIYRSGITPADAGKTHSRICSTCTAPDHPRGCGENENADLSGLVSTGSPPRMRGKRQ